MNTAGGGSVCKGRTKWKQNVLNPLTWKRTWLNVAVRMCLPVSVCASVNVHKHKREEEGLGSVSIWSHPHPAFYWLFFISLPDLFLAPPECRINNALNSHWLFLFLYFSPLLHQLVALEITQCCYASRGKKGTTEKINKQEIN